MTDLPLLKGFNLADPIAWRGGQAIECGQFLRDVTNLAEHLPNRSCVFNLCEDRYHFFVGFAAALIRGQRSLLPPSEAPQLLYDIAERFDNPYCLVDRDGRLPGIEAFRYPESLDTSLTTSPIPAFKPEQMAAVLFTSGSTGEPQANDKTWGSLVTEAASAKERFLTKRRQPGGVVGTVPPQHMYGLETTIMLPAQTGFALHSARPFFPEDVRMALEQVPVPRILVTTPTHIRACLFEHTTLPELDFIISATAPVPREHAQQAEQMFRTEVLEIYGFTEAGSIATRRTIAGEQWETLDGLELSQRGKRCLVHGRWLSEPVELADFVRLRSARQFTLHGRTADLINIAGKRGSLGDLNHKLNQIEGVHDGVFFMPIEVSGTVTRLVAFVVAPGLSNQDVLGKLRQSVDPVFLPRPLYMIDALPRTAAGKLPRARLQELAVHLEKKARDV